MTYTERYNSICSNFDSFASTKAFDDACYNLFKESFEAGSKELAMDVLDAIINAVDNEVSASQYKRELNLLKKYSPKHFEDAVDYILDL